MALVQVDDVDLKRLRSNDEQHTTLLQRASALEGELRAKDGIVKQLTVDKSMLEADRSRQQAELATAKAQVEERDVRLKKLEAERASSVQQLTESIAQLKKANIDLQNRLTELSQAPAKIKVDQLVTAFRDQIGQMNKAVMTQPEPNSSPVLVDQMEVEIKGGLDVSSGLQFVQLRPDQLSASSVSTVRFTLRPGSTIKLVDEQ